MLPLRTVRSMSVHLSEAYPVEQFAFASATQPSQSRSESFRRKGVFSHHRWNLVRRGVTEKKEHLNGECAPVLLLVSQQPLVTCVPGLKVEHEIYSWSTRSFWVAMMTTTTLTFTLVLDSQQQHSWPGRNVMCVCVQNYAMHLAYLVIGFRSERCNFKFAWLDLRWSILN